MENIKFLRESVFNFWNNEIIPSIKDDDKVLEVGPMMQKDFLYPEYFLNTRDRIKDYTSLDIYESEEIDVTGYIELLPLYFEPNSFDAVIALEVLEHVQSPWQVPLAINYVLKPGGSLYLSTPFWFLWHDPRPDYWRFSEDALRLLFEPYFELEITPLLLKGDDGRHPIHHRMKGIKK